MFERPASCATCRLHYAHHGFCGDYLPEKPVLAMVFDYPDKDAVLLGEPLIGALGDYWLNKLIRPLGYERKDILIVNTIRCKPPRGNFPVGTTAKHALAMCRQYDDRNGPGLKPGGIATFEPNLFVITEHPRALFLTPAMTRMVKRHFEKAFKRASEGWRVALLLGAQAMRLVAPELEGGVQKWHGHTFTGAWPGTPGKTIAGFRQV